MRKPAFCICKNKDTDQLRSDHCTIRVAKTKALISFAVTTKLISTFVFATQIVQSLYCLNTKFQASRHVLWLYSLVCIGPGRKPRRPVFSQRGSNILNCHQIPILIKLLYMLTMHSWTVKGLRFEGCL